MRKFCKRFLGFLFCFLIVFTAFLRFVPDRFAPSYQRAIVRQYDHYKSIKDEQKIVFIGYSTMCFGLDQEYMEELTGRKVAILANQVSVGYPIFMEMSKAYVKPGDVVVVEVNDWPYWDVGIDMMLTGIGKRVDLYQYIPEELRLEAAKRFPTVVKKNIEYFLNREGSMQGPYSLEAFDENGNYTFYRDECILSDPYEGESEWTDYRDTELDDDMIAEMADYVSYMEQQGVTVYFTISPVCKDVITPESRDAKTMDARDEAYQKVLVAPLISHTKDYVFEREYMWDAHPNTDGQKKRTELLYQDLLNATNGEL